MIRIPRSKTPPYLNSEEIKRRALDASRFYEEDADLRSQKRFKSLSLEIEDPEEKIGQLLRKEFNHRCAYCEQIIDPKSPAFNGRYRPKRNAKNLDGTESQDHYYWLTYTWKNLLLLCPDCFSYKYNSFPVKGNRCTIKATGASLKKENALLLNPGDEDPESSIQYSRDGEMIGTDERASMTIEILKLNRIDLLERRRQAGLRYIKNFSDVSSSGYPEDLKKSILEEINGEQETFRGYKRYLLKEKLHEFPHHLEQWSPTELEDINWKHSSIEKMPWGDVDRVISIDLSANQPFFIEEISISNFKNIEDQTIVFPQPEEQSDLAPWLFFLGENGSGKSTILQALSLCLCGEEVRNSLNLSPQKFLRWGTKSGFVIVRSRSGEEYTLMLEPDKMYGNTSTISTFLLGYGSTRLMAKGDKITEDLLIDRTKIGNLFDPTIGLVDAEKWLLGLDKVSFDRVAISLKDVLGLSEDIGDKSAEGDILRENESIYFRRPDQTMMELSTLSDGYKILIAVVCDIAKCISSEGTDMDTTDGIVLIDELGNHLHPRWKMRIVKSLRKAFSRIQFIISSHEPLCLRGIHEGEVRVLQYEDGQLEIIEELPNPSTFRVDQLLTSPFFGLNSVVDPEEEQLFDEYYTLLRKGDTISATEKQRLKILTIKVKKYNVLGNSLREELIYYAVDKLIAEKQKSKSVAWKNLKKETISSIEELWADYEIE